MPSTDRGPEGITSKVKGPAGISSKLKGPAGITSKLKGLEAEDDTEGHIMLPNDTLARHAAQSREQEIQRNLARREVKSEARRPFFKRGK
jgi:hypothetical protein